MTDELFIRWAGFVDAMETVRTRTDISETRRIHSAGVMAFQVLALFSYIRSLYPQFSPREVMNELDRMDLAHGLLPCSARLACSRAFKLFEMRKALIKAQTVKEDRCCR